jgi:Cell division protein CrgA
VATNTKNGPGGTKNGPGGASRKGKSAGGRSTAKGAVKTTSKVGRPSTAEESGRYTRPVPKSVRRSPPWYGALVLALLLVGVAIIVVNYLAHIPWVAHGSPWGLVAGLVLIFAGFLMATRYR